MSRSNRPSEKEPLTIKKVQFLHVPKIIEKKDLEKNKELNKEKGFLLSRDDVNDIREWVNNHKEKLKQGGRLTKADLKKYRIIRNPKFSIAIVPKGDDFQLIAIYYGENRKFKHGKDKNYTLGEGAWGKVKLGQDIETGEFFALKMQKSVLASHKKKHAAEIQIMKDLGVATGSINYVPTGPNINKYADSIVIEKNIGEKKSNVMMYAMNLAPGKDLSRVAKSLSLEELNHVAMGMIALVKSLHKKGYVHLDLKLQNFVYDRKTRTLNLIDYGESLKINPSEKRAEGEFRGSPCFMPPELRIFYQNLSRWDKIQSDEVLRKENETTIFQYGEKTDIYSLGVAIADLYGLAKEWRYGASDKEFAFVVVDKNSDEFKNNTVIEDQIERANVCDMLQRMTADEKSARMSLDEAMTVLRKFTSNYERSQSLPKVAILNSDELKELFQNPSGIFYLTQALKNFDEIVVVMPQEKMVASDVALAKSISSAIADPSELNVRDVLFGHNNPAYLAAQVADYANNDILARKSDYYYLTTKMLTEEDKKRLSMTAKPIQLLVDENVDELSATEKDEASIKRQVISQMQALPRLEAGLLQKTGLFGRSRGASAPVKPVQAPENEKERERKKTI